MGTRSFLMLSTLALALSGTEPSVAADADPDLRLYATAGPAHNDLASPPQGACGSAIRSYLASPKGPAEGRAYATFSFEKYACYTTFTYTFTRPSLVEGRLTLHTRISCELDTPADPSGFRFTLYRGAKAVAGPVQAHIAGSCAPGQALQLDAAMDDIWEFFQAGENLTVSLSHQIINPDFDRARNAFVLVGSARPLLQGKIVPEGSDPDAPRPKRAITLVPREASPREPTSSQDAWVPSVLALTALALLLRPTRAFLLGLFARLLKERLLEHPTRAEILAMVQRAPGITLHELVATLETPRTTLRFHLDMLVRGRFIATKKVGRDLHLFTPQDVSASRRMAQALLRRPWARRLLHVIEARSGLRQKEAAELLGIVPSTVRWEADRLAAAGLIQVQVGPNGRRYFRSPPAAPPREAAA